MAKTKSTKAKSTKVMTTTKAPVKAKGCSGGGRRKKPRKK